MAEGGVSKRGKGGSGPSFPFSLLLFYIEGGEAYASGGDGRSAALSPRPTISASDRYAKSLIFYNISAS